MVASSYILMSTAAMSVEQSQDLEERLREIEIELAGASNKAETCLIEAHKLYEDRFLRRRMPAALDEAIKLGRRGIDYRGNEHTYDHATALDHVGQYLSAKWKQEGETSDLEEALQFGIRAKQMIEPGRDKRPRPYGAICGNLAMTYIDHWESQRGSEDLHQAIKNLNESLKFCKGEEDYEAARTHNALAIAYEHLYRWRRDWNDLERAESAIGQAIQLFPLVSGYFDRRAGLMHTRSSRCSTSDERIQHLKAAIQDHRLAVEIATQQGGTQEEEHKTKSNLCRTLETLYLETGEERYIGEAIEAATRVLEETSKSYSQYALRVDALAGSMSLRGIATNSEEDIWKAIILREEVLLLPSFTSNTAVHATHFNNLAEELLHLSRTSHVAEKLVTYSRKAVEAAVTVEEEIQSTVTLCKALQVRGRLSRSFEHESEALRLLASKLGNADPRIKARICEATADILHNRYCRKGERDIELLSEIVALTEESRKPIGNFDIFSKRKELASQFANTELAIHLFLNENNCEVLRESKQKLERLMELEHNRDNKRLICASMVQVAYALFKKVPYVKHLDCALEYARRVLAFCDADTEVYSEYQFDLGALLIIRSHLLENIANEEGKGLLLSSFNDTKCSIYRRFRSGCDGGLLIAAVGDMAGARPLLDGALQLLPNLVTRELSPEDQQFVLSSTSSISSLAASIDRVMDVGAENALYTLESGRAYMIGTSLDMNMDLTQLTAVDEQKGQKYTALRQRFRLATRLPRSHHLNLDPFARRKEISEQMRLLEENIRRSVPGLENFLLPQPASGYKDLAKSPDHAIVTFNVTDISQDALIATSNGVQCLNLVGLLPSHLIEIEKRIHGVQRITDGSLETRLERNKILKSDLSWLWYQAVKPVLGAIGFIRRNKTAQLRRIIWVTSGIMGLMPLHAAGDSWNSMENTMSHVISSYIPSLKSLKHVQAMNEIRQEYNSKLGYKARMRLSAAYMQTTSGGYTDIKAERVIAHIDGVFDQLGQKRICKMMQPTKKMVLGRLSRDNMIFFACHGEADRADPSKSCLLLGDGSQDKPELLTVGEIASAQHPFAELAYLEACSTCENLSPSLREEVMHLGSSLQMAGFPHVIGTTWTVQNQKANIVAEQFFSLLKEQMRGLQANEGGTLRLDYALALHRAVEHVRDKSGITKSKSIAEQVTLWAPFIHVGC